MRLKRLISAFIACAMLVTFMPMQAFAADDLPEVAEYYESFDEESPMEIGARATRSETIELGESKTLVGKLGGLDKWGTSDPDVIKIDWSWGVHTAKITALQVSDDPIIITHTYGFAKEEQWEITVTPPAAKFFVLKVAGNEPENGADQGQDNYYPNDHDTIKVDGITYDKTTGLPGSLTKKGYELLQDNGGEYFALVGETPIDDRLVIEPGQKFMKALRGVAGLSDKQKIVWYVMKDQENGYHVDGYVSNIPVTVTYETGYPEASGIENKTFKDTEAFTGSYKLLSPEACGFSPSGYTFTGWKLENSETDKTYEPDTSFELTKAETFVAQWEKDEESDGSTAAYFYVLKPDFSGAPSTATPENFYYVGQGSIENPQVGEAEGQRYTEPKKTVSDLPNDIAAKLENIVWYRVGQANGANSNGGTPVVPDGITTWHVDGYLTAPLTVNAVNSENEQEFSGLANWPKSESVRVGTEYTVVVGTEGEADIPVLEKITVNGQHYAYDKPAQTDLLKDTMKLEGVHVNIPYALDNNEDGIPDKYQATVTFTVVNGTWEDGLNTTTKVVTLVKDKKWSEEGSYILKDTDIPTGMTPNDGYEGGSWDESPKDTIITKAGATFTYTFTKETTPPVQPDWDTSKSKTATDLDTSYESKVMLSLPAAQETLESDVVFVLDKSTSADVEDQMIRMLEDLNTQAEETGAVINVGVVAFNKEAHRQLELTQLTAENMGAIQDAIKVDLKSGTNTHAGLLAGKAMLDADTDVDANRKYLVFVSDGITYLFDTPAQAINSQQATNGEYAIMASNDCWSIRHYEEGGAHFIPDNWNSYLADVGQHFDEVKQYIQAYEKMDQGNHIPRGNTELPTTVDVALYKTSQVFNDLQDAGYHCYAVPADTNAAEGFPWGPSFMNYLADGKTVSFADIQNDIYYLLSAGSQVVDVIGSGIDNKDNPYNFDFVDEVGALSLKVGNEILTAEKIADDPQFTDMNATSIYGFSREGEFGNYPFVLLYYANGQDGKPDECFVWKINENVSNFAPVQLTYTVKLTNPQTKPGTYGDDADGSEEKGSLYTNNSATLHPVDSNGVAGAPETFAKPTVSYTIEDTTITVTFRPGNHGTLRNAQADGTVRYSDIEEGKGLGADQSVPRVDEDDDWDFTEWLCTEGAEGVKGQTYSAAQIAKLIFTQDTIFEAQYEEESGGGGAHHPDARDDDDDDNDRNDEDDTEESIDEEVPLAETPWLNTEDHYAYIVGYSEDGTVRPNANITRAEVATIFFRLLTDEARDQFWMTSNNFSDVLPNDWYNNAVSTMVNMGIIQGYEDGTFRPNANITRAEFAAIAARFMSSGYDVEEDLFTDIANHWARESINDAAIAGWINGYEDGAFRPDAAITRAEAVTLVNNVLQRKPDADHMFDSMIKWPDNPEGTWYYEAIQEATNSHDYDLFEDAEYETWTALQPNRDWAAIEKGWLDAHSA